jgi:hypothetical protein
MLSQERATELVLGEPCCRQSGSICGIALLIQPCQWRHNEYQRRKPISASTAEIAPPKLATHKAASSRRPSATGSSKIGTIRIAYVQAYASAVAFDHVRDEIADEAAGGQIRSTGEGFFEGDGRGSGDAPSEFVCECHTAVVLHQSDDLGNHRS